MSGKKSNCDYHQKKKVEHLNKQEISERCVKTGSGRKKEIHHHIAKNVRNLLVNEKGVIGSLEEKRVVLGTKSEKK